MKGVSVMDTHRPNIFKNAKDDQQHKNKVIERKMCV